MSDFAGTVPTRDPNYNARAGDTFPFRNSYREPAPEIVFQRGQGCAKGLRPWSFERWPFRRHFFLGQPFCAAKRHEAARPKGACGHSKLTPKQRVSDSMERAEIPIIHR
jgi:hypothetical protein